MAAPLKLTRTHRILAGLVVTGGLVIAGIGFAGSYSAVRALAERQGFGAFAAVFPIGIDAGICVLLALDLLLTWIRIPFPLLRQTAWLLTAATIAFNGAAAWPDPLGVGMHAVIPVLFVVSVEAARHAVGRIADITADKHMEGVRLTRWLLSPVPTFLLWRRMKLWELRSYEQTIRLEQERLIYQARLHSRFGRAWRRKAPIESLMPLRLARYGVPLAETAPAGLAAAGIKEPLPVLTPYERSSIPALVTEEPTAVKEAQETRTESTDAIDLEERVAPALPVDDVVDEPVEQSPVIDSAAYMEYINRYGDFPSARQFALFLADVYGVVDPATQGPLSEAALRPQLKEMRWDIEAQGWMNDPSDAADNEVVTVRDYEHPFFGGSPSAGAPATSEPTAAAVASITNAPAASTMAPRHTAAASAGATPVGAQEEASVQAWESMVTDSGEATARAPEQLAEEPAGELGEGQRIEQVVQWLIEAEEAGKKLSGAEAARRNSVSPKTGQRDVIKAREILEQRRKEEGRTRLRSVRS